MSPGQDNCEKIERLYEAFENEGARAAAELIGETFDANVEFHTLQTGNSGGRTYRGFDGLGGFFGELHSEFEDVHYEAPQFHQVGEDVVALTCIVGTDRSSSIPVRQDLALVYRFAQQKVVVVEAYDSPAEALEAAQRGHADA